MDKFKKRFKFFEISFLLITVFINNTGCASIATTHSRFEKDHLLALFVGGTGVESNNYFTYGVEYHKALTFPFGYSITLEDTLNNKVHHHEIEVIGLMSFSCLKHITFGIGPGLKFEKGESDKLLGRVAFNYIFKLKPTIEITPTIKYNIVQRSPNEIVYGAKFGKQF